MKKLLVIFLVCCLIFCLTACSMPAMSTTDGNDTVAGVAIKTGLNIVEALVLTALGIAGTAWAAKSKDKAYMQNISLAVDSVLKMAQITVGELKQTTVDWMKANSDTGKLSDEQIEKLKSDLLSLTLKKMDEPTKALLEAAGVDICALISGAGEDFVRKLKNDGPFLIDPLGSITELLKDGDETPEEAEADTQPPAEEKSE